MFAEASDGDENSEDGMVESHWQRGVHMSADQLAYHLKGQDSVSLDLSRTILARYLVMLDLRRG